MNVLETSTLFHHSTVLTSSTTFEGMRFGWKYGGYNGELANSRLSAT